MKFDALLQDAEKYRCGKDYKGTNIVFPALYKDKKYIVKKVRAMGSMLNAYYALQDKAFYGTRKLGSSAVRLENEAKKLQQMDGFHAPRLATQADGILVRDFVEGTDIRKMESLEAKVMCLEGALDAITMIHCRGVVIGDAHAKNCIQSAHMVYWIDFEGAFDESDAEKAKAVDLLKFVYSAYTITKDAEASLHIAELASHYWDKKVMAKVQELASPGLSALRVWFPARLPLDGKLNKSIKCILRSC